MILFKKLSISQKIVISFLTVIIIGTFLLSLPISNLSTSKATIFDHLFNCVSMVCVTGLFSVPVYATYSTIGKFFTVILIQIGGLGLMTIIVSLLLGAGKKIRYSYQKAISESLNKESVSDFSYYIKNIIKYTAIIELVGSLLLMIDFIPRYGLIDGIGSSLFISVSAFCNAGFDPFGINSLHHFVTNPLVNIVISILIILGGIGFSVWFDVTKSRYSLIKNGHLSFRSFFKKLKPHTKLAIKATIILLFIGTVLGVIFEYNNMATLGQYNLFDKIMIAFFQSTTMRTAGFSTVDYTLMNPITNLFYIVLMMIGGSPGGTAGGIKTVTIALVFFLIVNEFKQNSSINYDRHRIPITLINKALVILVMFLFVLSIGIGLLVIFEPNVSLLALIFEATSALGTVGVSMNLTPLLSIASKMVIMLLMFFGRIGPMTVILSIKIKEKNSNEIVYPDGRFIIG